jgi:hypothetical protein
LIRCNRKGFSIYKAGRVRWNTPGFCEERVSQEDFLDRVSKTAASTRNLSDPVRAGASENLGAFRLSFD